MNYTEAKHYLSGKPDAVLDYPFAPDIAMFKIRGKMFATLIETNGHVYSNLKCEPGEALMLRDIFPEVTPGYHMNKKHWNTVHLDGQLPDVEIKRLMDKSYALVVHTLTRADRQAPEIRHGKEALYR